MSSKHICVTKTQFYSESTAQFRADDINFDHGYEKFRVYKCPYCNFYHLTSKI
jgi:hypothetical protein